MRAPPAIAFFLLASLASAQMTRNVPGQYPTIQSAINVCVNGDNVFVAPGVYPGAINFLGKAITVHSSGGAAVTTITGNSSAAVVGFMTNEGPLSVLDGFTVSGGNGGVWIQNASPVIQNCQVVNNVATVAPGGGIRCFITGTNGVASPTLLNCAINNNLAIQGSSGTGYGGGVVFDGSTSATSFPLVNGCTISSNIAQTGDGGGVSVNGSWTPTFVSCAIEGNTARNGGGAWLNGVLVALIRTRIRSNFAFGNYSYAGFGGGVSFNGGMTMTGCLVSGNSASGNGGGVSGNTSQTGSILNCTIVGNTAVGTTGGCAIGAGPAQFAVNNSIIWGNSALNLEALGVAVTYSDVGFGYYTAGVGTINVDPRFVDAANGDYHLARSSPCRDAGAPLTTGLPPTDLDGTPRIVNTIVDIGADEVPALAYPGTNEDAELYAWVNGAGDPLASARPASSGSLLKFLFKSPGGTLVGANPLVAGIVFATGSGPSSLPGFPQIWLDQSAFIIVGTLGPPPLSVPGLPSNGMTLEFQIPPWFAGTTARLQALVESPFTANGLSAITNATEAVF